MQRAGSLLLHVALPVLLGAGAATLGGTPPAGAALCGGGALLLLGLLRLASAQWVARPGEPPLFGGVLPYIGRALEFGRDHRALLQRLAARSGASSPAFTMFVAGQRMTFVKNPLHFSAVLKEGRQRLQFRPVANKIMQQAFDCSTADMNGEAYAGWQRLSPKQWSMLRGKPLLALMSRTQDELVDALCAQRPPSSGPWHSTDDLYGVVVDLMWRATGRSFFGSLFDDANVEKNGEARSTFAGGGSSGSAALGSMNIAKEAFRTFDEAFPLLAAGVPGKYLPKVPVAMSHLFSRFAHKDGPGVSRHGASEIVRLRQEFLAAHFDPHSQGSFQLGFVWATMANTLPTAFWSLYFVTRDREAYAKCREEADCVMGPWLDKREAAIKAGRGSPAPDASAVANILSNMPRLESVVSEALRMCIASITLREAMEDFELTLGEQVVRVRRGDHVVLAPTLTHFDPEIYPDPESFQWDRFLVPQKDDSADADNGVDEGNEGKAKEASLSGARALPPRFKSGKKIPPAIALQPFGGGHTMCPGRHFALAEIKAFVALVLCMWDIEHGDPCVGRKLVMGEAGTPRLEQARAGLGSLPPLKSDKVKCRWRLRRDPGGLSSGR
jgi:cholesterol 7alpha-monooxygenase